MLSSKENKKQKRLANKKRKVGRKKQRSVLKRQDFIAKHQYPEFVFDTTSSDPEFVALIRSIIEGFSFGQREVSEDMRKCLRVMASGGQVALNEHFHLAAEQSYKRVKRLKGIFALLKPSVLPSIHTHHRNFYLPMVSDVKSFLRFLKKDLRH